jgi:tetratricopeptide (TPR) repeat protein
VLLQQGRYEDALDRFGEADRVAPNNATTKNMIGLCYLNLGQHAEAISYFDRALDLIPNFTDARNNRGSTYLSLGQYRMAEVDFTSVLSDTTYPHHWEAYYNLGLANIGLRQLGAAEDNFQRAVTAPTPVFEAHVQLAELYQQQGKVEPAIELLEEAIIKFPDRYEAHLALGRILTQQNRKKEAKPYLETVVTLRPDSDLAKEAQRYLEGG